MDFDLSTGAWLLLAAAALLIGFAKSGVPGAGLLVIPLFAAVFPAGRSTGILLPLLVVGDLVAVAHWRGCVVWRHLLRPLPWALTGILVGWYILRTWAPTDAQFRVLIALIVLAMLALGARPRDDEAQRRNARRMAWIAPALGLLGGFTTMAANGAGPIFIVYLLMMGLPKAQFNGTRAWIFLILNLCKLPLSADLGFLDGATLSFNLMLAPLVPLGSWVGKGVVDRLSDVGFASLVRLLTLVAGLKLLYDGLYALYGG